MKIALILIAVLLSVSNRLTGQTRAIRGRVISEDLQALAYVSIRASSAEIGKTDIDGQFKITIPQNTQTLLFGGLGMERAPIKLTGDCDTIEVVMLYSGSNDFMSPRKIDKDRLHMFNKLPELHLQAYNKGLFTKKSICYTREFEPEKPQFDSIAKEDVKKEKQIKLTFKRLNIGDTVKIPFSGQYRADGTDRTTLNSYSSFTNERHYDSIIKCVI